MTDPSDLRDRWAPNLCLGCGQRRTTAVVTAACAAWHQPTVSTEPVETAGDVGTREPITIPTNKPTAYSEASATITYNGQIFPHGQTRVAPAPVAQQEEAKAKAIVLEIDGKQIVAAPAATIQKAAAITEPTIADIAEQHLLWMEGRFVGANEPNRNGAFWTGGDLELGQSTVVHGPLNWLHEVRHVVGVLADATYVDASEAAAAGTRHPYITATAAVWRWIWPDEAYVIQQASDQQQLWYSMECISREVSCAGPNGCGATTSYADYAAGAACEHVRERSSVRHFKNPVFLGGAVIVPPTRPGWAEADATVMSKATSLAEAAFEQAGKPDVSASTWEQMMAQIVKSVAR